MASKGFIKIPSATAHQLYKLGKIGIEAISIYNFVQYTALWQNEKYGINNRPKATNEYCMNGLHIRRQTFLQAKKILVGLGLVKSRKLVNPDTKKIVGHYLELPFINNQKPEVPNGTYGGQKTIGSQNHSVETGTTNTDSKNNKNTDIKDIPEQALESANTTQHNGSKVKQMPRGSNLPHTTPNLSVDYGELLELARANPNYAVDYDTKNPEGAERHHIHKLLKKISYEKLKTLVIDMDRPFCFGKLKAPRIFGAE